MFTGIVETVGTVKRLERRGEGARLSLDPGAAGEGTRKGESICVSGVCLTVAGIEGALLEFDATSETLSRTTVGEFRPGRRVNLERALRADSRLGGHFVLGHVDTVGAVASFDRRTGSSVLRVSMDPDYLWFLTTKGSVAVDGVSLTVVEANRKDFSVALIPESMESTTLGALSTGDRVNVEVDYLAKIVLERMHGLRGERPKGVDWGALEQAGFV